MVSQLRKLLIHIDQYLKRVTQADSANIFFILGLLITFSSTFLISTLIHREELANFNNDVKNITAKIEIRLQLYANTLVATGGFLETQHKINRRDFRSFVSSFDIQNLYPGLRAIGYASFLQPNQVSEHLRQLRNETNETVRLWPKRPTSEYVVMVDYLEPTDWLNKRAIGFDLSSESNRRQAIEAARDTGKISIANKVLLLNEAIKKPHPSYIIFFPIYYENLPSKTVEERRKAIKGFILFPFRPLDFLAQINKEIQNSRPDLSISAYEDQSLAANKILYNSSTKSSTKVNRLRSVENFHVFNHDNFFTLVVESSKGFKPAPFQFFAYLVFTMGCLLSLFAYCSIRSGKMLNRQLSADIQWNNQLKQQHQKAQVLAEQANKAKTQFLAAISHEIRTPLGIIQGFTELSLSADNLPQEVEGHLNIIKKNCSQLSSLVGNVLELYKIESLQVELFKKEISIPSFMNEIISHFELLASKKKIDLHLNIDSNLPEFIITDETKLRQIINNLMINSIKFTLEGSIDVTAKAEAGNLSIVIKDTGIGMSPEFLKNVFQTFSQDRENHPHVVGGTGLGLSLSRQLARALGGELMLVQSNKGIGTTFQINIPIEQNQAHKIEIAAKNLRDETSKAQKRSEFLKDVRILLAEDCRDNQLLFCKFLNSAGAITTIANNGQEAIEKIKSEEFEIILMDIQMPVLNGFETTKALRQMGYQNTIIALTAHAFDQERIKALDGGFDHFLTKPISMQNLLTEVRKFI